MVNFISDKYSLLIAGLEKSGPFVEHANEIVKGNNLFGKGKYLLLDYKLPYFIFF